MNPLPPDPYLALGVSKTAPLSEIRSAHRKLVLKCHPDKVQDEALKAVKQDEFQKVQQAYELLSNETQRSQYDAQVKLYQLRKEMGRGGPMPAGPGAGANVYYAEPRTSSTAYRPKPSAQAYSSRYESDEARYSTPRRASRDETKSKSASKDEERRARRKEEERAEARREADLREAKREKEALYSERKKSRDKDRRKVSDDKRRTYIERSESDSEEIHRPTRSTARIRMQDLVDMLPKTTRRTADIDTAERRREKTKAHIEHAYRYMNAANRGTAAATEPPRSAKVPYVPDSPPIDTIEEEDTPRRSSGRTSADTPRASRRAQNSSRSRDSPRLSSKDKKRSDPRMVDADLPTRTKPTLSSQKSAPPEIPSSREKPQRSNTMDTKHSSKSTPAIPPLPRASTFNGSSEKSKLRSAGTKQRVVYESASESSSESDSPIYNKQPGPTRPSPMQKTSSYKIVRDINGQRAERVHNLNDIYNVPRERSLSPRRTAADYQRNSSSRTASSRAPQSQPIYAAAQSIPTTRTRSPEREREPNVKTVRPGMRETQSHSQWSRQPSMYEEVKVAYSPNYGKEDVAYSQDYMRRSSDPDARYSNYPAANQAYRREEIAPRKMAYAS